MKIIVYRDEYGKGHVTYVKPVTGSEKATEVMVAQFNESKENSIKATIEPVEEGSVVACLLGSFLNKEKNYDRLREAMAVIRKTVHEVADVV